MNLILNIIYGIRSIANDLIDILESNVKPEYLGTSTVDDVAEMVLPYIPNVQFLDGTYQNVTLESMMKYLGINTISEELYVPQFKDCENFAIPLFVDVQKWAPSCPFGFVFGKDVNGNGHAWNCFIADGKLWYIEPQDDTIYMPLGEIEWSAVI